MGCKPRNASLNLQQTLTANGISIMDLLSFLGFNAFGPFLGGMIANILSNRTDSSLKQLESLLAAKLQEGQIPANHDLQHAVPDALRQALRGLALSLADSLYPASPFLQAVRQQLLNPQGRKLSVTSLLDVPFWISLNSAERAWIDAFAKLIENAEAVNRLAGLGLATEGGFLTAEFADLKNWLESRFDRLDGQLKGIAGTHYTY